MPLHLTICYMFWENKVVLINEPVLAKSICILEVTSLICAEGCLMIPLIYEDLVVWYFFHSSQGILEYNLFVEASGEMWKDYCIL